jgi:hypothetical protein
MSSSDTKHKARGRQDAVIRTQYGGTQPANALGVVRLGSNSHESFLPELDKPKQLNGAKDRPVVDGTAERSMADKGDSNRLTGQKPATIQRHYGLRDVVLSACRIAR